MSSLASPRGPLPPRVYWVRRGVALAVVLVVLLLVVTLVKLAFGGGDDKPSADATAHQAAGEPTAKDVTKNKKANKKAAAAVTEPALVEPSVTALPEPNGRCTPADVEISPRVTNAQAYIPVALSLDVKSRKAAACLWRFGPKTVSVKVMRSDTTVWSSSACLGWIKPQDLVLRAETVTPVTVTWSGRRSDSGCTEQYSDFAGVGTYQVVAAPLGGEASAVEFGLRKPTASATPTVTATATASGTPTGTATPPKTRKNRPATRPKRQPSSRASTPTHERVDPSAQPSGAVEP